MQIQIKKKTEVLRVSYLHKLAKVVRSEFG